MPANFRTYHLNCLLDFANVNLYFATVFYHIRLFDHILYRNIVPQTTFFFSDSTGAPERVEVPTEKTEKRAHQKMLLSRELYQGEGECLLFHTPSEMVWGSEADVKRGRKQICQYSAVRHIVRHLPKASQRQSPRGDERFMAAFLKNCSLNTSIYNPSLTSRGLLMPNKVSLLDLISVDSRRLDAWCVARNGARAANLFTTFQDTKGLGLELLNKVEVREILIGQSSSEECVEMLNWSTEMYNRDYEECPTCCISMDVEALQVLKEDHERVINSAKTGEGVVIKNLLGSRIKKGTATQLPVRIMIGNGYSWALMITLLTTPVQTNKFLVTPPIFQIEVTHMLKKLPLVAGVGIRGDVTQITELIRTTSDPEFTFRGFVDIPCLAVAAGWNFPYYNMQALAVQIFGTFLNKHVSCGDHKWGFKWNDIPDPLKVYCLGDVKFGHQAVVILFTILLRDIFPDPDISLSFAQLDGWSFMKWFCKWIANTLQGLEVDHQTVVEATCRKSVLAALRFRKRDGSRASAPPSRIRDFACLLGPWPSIAFGGPRFLHQVREHFLLQVRIMLAMNPEEGAKIWPHELSITKETAATYSIPGLSSLDYRKGIIGASLGLCIHPDLAHLLLTGSDLSAEAARQVAERYSRVRREVVYEWVRLNLDQLRRFLSFIPNDSYYTRWLRSYLLESRAIYRRCTGQIAPDLPDFSQELQERSRKQYFEELEAVKELEERISQRMLRASVFRFQMEGDSAGFPCPVWRGELPAVNPSVSVEIRRPSYLSDSKPSRFLREVRQERKEECLVGKWKRREEDEERPKDLAVRKKRKKEMLAPVAEYFHEEMDIEIHNNIQDSELLVDGA